MAKKTIFRIEEGTVRKLRDLQGCAPEATSMGYKVYLENGKPYLQVAHEPTELSGDEAKLERQAMKSCHAIAKVWKSRDGRHYSACRSRPYELTNKELEEVREAANILFSTFPIANATLGLALHLYELSAKKATESLIEQISTDRKSA
jgi:hypothetical protein